MAKRGTAKRRSMDQEAYIARKYNGKVSPSSGAAVSDAGDVRTPAFLIECKQSGEHGKEKRSMSIKLDDFEKIADEAWAESKIPMMTLRLYCPSSILADAKGHVDLAVRLVDDDEHLINLLFAEDVDHAE